MKPLWLKAEKARSRLLTASIITVAALLLLAGIGHRILEYYESLSDKDRLAALSLVMSGVPSEALPVTLLEVDDATRIAWNSRQATPHAALALLIEESWRKGASLILVDFDLTGGTDGKPADPAMAKTLRDYPPGASPLLLVRKIGFTRGDAGAAETVLAARVSATSYDELVRGKSNVYWITALNDIESDRAVRQLRLWQTVCDGASGTAFPSAALVTAARLYPDNIRIADLARFLEDRVAEECGARAVDRSPWPPVRDRAVSVPFVFAGTEKSPGLFRIQSGDRIAVAFRRISAGQLVTHADGVAATVAEIDRDPFLGRAVILGATYSDSGDFYETPFGTMPGSIILANSIMQAKKIVETPPVSPWIRNVIAMLLFLIYAVIARHFVGSIAVVLMGLLSLAAIFVLSRIYGFDTALAIITVSLPGFALFKLVDSLAHIALNVPKNGWRAVLKT